EGIDVRGKTVMFLGPGGTSRTAEVVLKRRGAKEIIKVGRNSPVNYANCYLVKGVRAIVNTTPVGMYPDVEGCPIDVSRFDGLESVVDVVYNPLNTLLVRKAGELGVKASGGLLMLVAQAVRSAEIFTGEVFGEGTIEKLFKETRNRACGVAFIGMPGSGKTTLVKMTPELLGKKFTDTDAEAEKIAGKTVEEIFASDGEKVFRDLETEAIRAAAQEKNAVISTGGGAVIREDNRMKLKENSVVIRVVRRVENLCASGRPLSSSIENLRKLESQREPIYRDLADFSVNNDGEISAAFEKIKEFLL
ncbi:MAG: shikimate kinase, partial [Clostridia bacterium]|nr:shikimate kinase [Clostridia bacterium]